MSNEQSSLFNEMEKLKKRFDEKSKEDTPKEDNSLSEQAVFQLMTKAAIPERFKKATFDSFEDRTEKLKNLKKAMLNYSRKLATEKEFNANCLMLGSVGSGKTHLAISALKNFISFNKTGYFITLNSLLMSYKNFGVSSVNNVNIDYALNADLLVIDEVNTFLSEMSDFDKNNLFTIFNHRYNKVKPTIIISNLNPKQIEQALGVQVLSRLFEDTKNQLIFNEEDYRGISK